MIERKRSNQTLDAKCVHDEEEGGGISKNLSKCLPLRPVVISDHQVNDTECLYIKQAYEYREDEYEEVAVVSLSDAISYPGAMVIKIFDAVVANSTVDCSNWPVDVASICSERERDQKIEVSHKVSDCSVDMHRHRQFRGEITR